MNNLTNLPNYIKFPLLWFDLLFCVWLWPISLLVCISFFPFYKEKPGFVDHAWDRQMVWILSGFNGSSIWPREESEGSAENLFSTSRKAGNHSQWKTAHLSWSPESAPCRHRNYNPVVYKEVNISHCMPLHFLSKKN